MSEIGRQENCGQLTENTVVKPLFDRAVKRATNGSPRAKRIGDAASDSIINKGFARQRCPLDVLTFWGPG